MNTNTLERAMTFAVLAAALSACIDADYQPEAARSLSITGHGEAAGRPDQAAISAGVQTLAPTVVEASRQNQQVVERIMAALEEQGIPEENVQTANYSIWPERRRGPDGGDEPQITGFRVSNIVNVTIDDIDKVGEVLAAVTNAGANSINGISFGVKDTEALEREARAAAMQDARTRAADLAKLAGVELGEVMTISTSAAGIQPASGGPAYARVAAEAAPAPGISPGEHSVAVTVYVTFAIR